MSRMSWFIASLWVFVIISHAIDKEWRDVFLASAILGYYLLWRSCEQECERCHQR